MARTKSDLGYALGRFQSIGLSRAAGIGILSSLAGESGRGLDTNAFNPNDPEGGAFGIAQWVGKRRRALRSYAEKAGKDYRDFRTQVDFIAHELVGKDKNTGGSSERRAYDLLKGVNDSYAAQAIWTKNYERPAKAEQRARERNKHVDYYARVLDGVDASQMTQMADASMAKKTTTKTVRRKNPGILDIMFNSIGGQMSKFGQEGSDGENPGVIFPSIGGTGGGKTGGQVISGGGGSDTLTGGTGSVNGAGGTLDRGVSAGGGLLGVGQGLGIGGGLGGANAGGLIGTIAGGLLGGPAGTLVGGLLGNSITNLLNRIGDEQTAVLGGNETEEVITEEEDDPQSPFVGIDEALKRVGRAMGRTPDYAIGGSEMGGNHGADFNKGEMFVDDFYRTLAKDPKRAEAMAAKSPYGRFVRNDTSGNTNTTGRGSIEKE